MPSSPIESPIPTANDEATSRVHVRHHGQQAMTTPPVRARAATADYHAAADPTTSPRPIALFPNSPTSSIASKFTPSKSRRHRIHIRAYNYWRRLRAAPRMTLVVIATLFLLAAVVVASTCFWLFHHLQCYQRERGVVWREAPIHDISRTCPAPSYDLVAGSQKPKICMTTLTDRQSPSFYQRLVRCRDFDALDQISFANHQKYALKHGYLWKDSSDLLDPSRPPAWSKIKAVQSLLQLTLPSSSSRATIPDCDWVLWLDADVLIMNSDIRLEELLPSDPETMLIATYDRKFTVNSGVWLLRNSDWSRQFLADWWNLTSWVRRSGMSLSGDNAAFGHLVDQVLQTEPKRRVQIPARCNFNSFGVFLTEQQQEAIVAGGIAALAKQEWYMSDKFYHKGDFIVHASGIDKKKEVLEMLVTKAI